MKLISHWGKPVAILVLGLSSLAYPNAPSTAVTDTPIANVTTKSELNLHPHKSTLQLAQGLVGRCRAAKQRIFVYPERSTSSQSIRTLAPDEQVTLADNGANGWIAINAPIAGYVRANDLKSCPGGTRPPVPNPQPSEQTSSQTGSGSNICRNVIYPPEGLAVRNIPDITAPRISGVYVGNTVKLVSPRESQKDSQGRTWVKISSPSTGWISSGFPNGNLSAESACP